MLTRSMLFLAFGAFALGPATAATVPAVTTPFDLAQNFVSQIGTLEHDRLQAAKNQAVNKEDFAGCVRDMTIFQLDLAVSAKYLMAVELSSDNMAKDVPSMIGSIIAQKYSIVGDLIQECQALITPDPKVDYTALARRAPQLTAMSNYTDRTFFEASPGIFVTLVSPRVDSNNHIDHLLITREQRGQLLRSLVSKFGDDLNASGNDIPYYVAIAQLFRAKLIEFKCADDPWE